MTGDTDHHAALAGDEIYSPATEPKGVTVLCAELPADPIDSLIGSFQGLRTFGRQGLFAHDNMHHAPATAHAAVDCLQLDGGRTAAYSQRSSSRTRT